MGMYINPQNKSKEVWLQEHITRTYGRTPPSSINELQDSEALVCLVDNGHFTAAAVAFSNDELDAFTRSDDVRPKAWFVVPKDSLKSVCPDYESYMR